MASRREQVIAGIKTRLQAAFPNADVKRGDGKSDRVGGGGMLIVGDGSAEIIEQTLSPLTTTYEHLVPVEVAAYAAEDPKVALDAMLQTFGAALLPDRTLGGLCDWIDIDFPDVDDVSTEGARSATWATVTVRATYTVTGALA